MSIKFFGKGILTVPIYSKYRVSSFFYDELIMGSFFLRLIIILNPLFIFLYSSKKNLIYLFLINILTLLIILQSGERASLFLVIIYFFMNLLILNFNFKKKLIFLVSIIVILSSVTISSQLIKNRFIDQPFVKGKFLENHVLLFQNAINMNKNSPLLGNGYRSFQVKCHEEQFFIEGKPQCSTHPHNTYLQLLAELGLIGFLFIFLFFLYFVLQYLKSFYYQFLNSNSQKNHILLCISGLIINFFPLTTTGNFFNNWLSSLYFFPLGIYIYFIKYKE